MGMIGFLVAAALSLAAMILAFRIAIRPKRRDGSY